MNRPSKTTSTRSEFADALRKGVLIGAAALLVLLPPFLKSRAPASAPPAASAPQVAGAPGAAPAVPPPVAASSAAPAVPPRQVAAASSAAPAVPPPQVAAAPAPAVPARPEPPVKRFADFGGSKASADVRRMADWVMQSGDHQGRSFVIVDKKGAQVYAFDPRGRLQAAVPALLGSARGDDTVPGIGDKPIAQVQPEERTTPAGRFVAEMGISSSRGEDVVWVDYDAAVSMHRVLKVPARLRALSSPTREDNRMSYGCINLPDAFFEKVLRPAVKESGAIIYVLPETRPLREAFASFYDVTAPAKHAQD